MNNHKCYNCTHASKGFKIAGKTHHSCLNPMHDEKLKSGELSAWDMLMEFWQTCEHHELKESNYSKKSSSSKLV